MTVIRNPLNQALSHFHHAQRVLGAWANFSAFLEFGLCVGSTPTSGDPLDECRSHLTKPLKWSDMSSDLFAIFRDNIQLRWLDPVWLEQPVTKWPQLSGKYLENAKARLKEFDQVLVLEEMHSRDRWRLAKYGWSDLNDEYAANLHNPPGTPWKPSDAVEYLKDQPSVLARLREIQRWDIAFYQYGVSIARHQAVRDGVTNTPARQPDKMVDVKPPM